MNGFGWLIKTLRTTRTTTTMTTTTTTIATVKITTYNDDKYVDDVV